MRRFAYTDPAATGSFRAAADNVGWRDQRFVADYERTGRFVVSGVWDQIPQFYSVDTKTPYTTTAARCVLDDATQRAIQSGAGHPRRLRADRAAVRARGAPRHRPRQRGRHADADSST